MSAANRSPDQTFRSVARKPRFPALWALATLLLLTAQPVLAQAFQSQAPIAFLYDSQSGAVLYEKAPDEAVAPASMAKIATALVAFQEIAAGRLNLDSEIGISENAWRKGGAPARGTTMFAAVRSRIKLSDILQGLIVQAGNDAAIALAEAIAGDEPTFARIMNERVKALGLTRSVFRNATGMPDPEQKVTARELAMLADHVVKTYPELYRMFGQREFTWNKIRQVNRNPLLTMDLGADGLQTGDLDGVGFGLTGSAVENGQRLIVVVHGLKTGRDRATEAQKLLEWGFRAFERRQLFTDGEIVGDVSVYGGEKGRVPLRTKGAVTLLMPRGTADKLSARIVYRGPLAVPVTEGDAVAQLVIMRGDVKTLELPLYAAETVKPGSLQSRALDAVIEISTGWVRQTLARVTRG
jgi:D-alanyl-D-alanine carboxypeptidase (penicillin-binding protein 5/6)